MGGHQVATFRIVDSPERAALERWLEALPDCVVRVKGLVSSPTGPLLVEGVGRRRRVRDAPHSVAESQVVGTLVVIGTAALAPNELVAPPGC